MNLDHEAIGSGGDRALGDGIHQGSLARAMRRVRDQWQVRKLLQGGDSVDIEGVSRVSFKCADAALAKDDLVVALACDVFRSLKVLFQQGRHAALRSEEHTSELQ